MKTMRMANTVTTTMMTENTVTTTTMTAEVMKTKSKNATDNVTNKVIKALFTLFGGLLLLFLMVLPAEAKGLDLGGYHLVGNENANRYSTHDAPETSSLTVTSDGKYMKVQYDAVGKISIEYYDTSFQLLSSKTLEKELPLYGGFYNSGSNYYLVFGQSNLSENDSTEVYRVVKYDKNWNRISAASLYGANTYVPFNAGSCRLTDDGTNLYVLTCHTMYASGDGKHHQANVFIKIDTRTMKVSYSRTDISNRYTGYVSHSFNQYIVHSNGYVYTLDHGDAYPRAAMLGRVRTNLSGLSNFDLITYYGEMGENTTNATVGGLVANAKYVATVGTSTVQTSMESSEQNTYVTITPVNSFSSGSTQFT